MSAGTGSGQASSPAPTAAGTVPRLLAPLFQVREKWSDPWADGAGGSSGTYDTYIELESCTWSGRGDQIGELHVRRVYSSAVSIPPAAASGVKKEWEAGFRASSPRDYTGWYIKMFVFDEAGVITPVWMGVIDEQIDNPNAVAEDDASLSGAGWQRFIAFDGAHLLRKIDISRSRWLVQRDPSPTAAVEQEIDWVPDMNFVDERHLRMGNRSSVLVPAPGDPTFERFIYEASSSSEFWSRREFIVYVLGLCKNGDALPKFSFGGEGGAYGALLDMRDFVRMADVETAHDVIRRLVHPGIGMEFMVKPVFGTGSTPVDSFEVFVYSILPNEITVKGETLPANANQTDFVLGADVEERPTITRSSRNVFDRIRVVGARIVACTTLYHGLDLEEKWTPEQEAEYAEPLDDPGATLKELDAARQTDRFAAVYSKFGAPVDFNIDFIHRKHFAPVFNELGELQEVEIAQFQNEVRRTLHWIPLLEGYEYTNNDIVNKNPAGVNPESKAPFVLISAEPNGVGPWMDAGAMITQSGDVKGVHVRTPNDDWGVVLTGRINHEIALDVFTGNTTIPAEFSYVGMTATIAIETDQRIELVAQFVADDKVRSEKLIEVPDCEVWIVAPFTIWGVSPEGDPLYTGSSSLILRNDVEKLYLPMAGAIARYGFDRSRADISLKGYALVHGLLGQILGVIKDRSVIHYVGGPITGVTWRAGRGGNTTIQAGWAE